MIFRVREILIGLVDGWESTQLLTKIEGYWKMSIVIFLPPSKQTWTGTSTYSEIYHMVSWCKFDCSPIKFMLSWFKVQTFAEEALLQSHRMIPDNK